MDIKSILVHADSDPQFEVRLALAMKLADAHRAHLIGVFSCGPPVLISYVTGFSAALVAEFRGAQDKAAGQLRTRFLEAAAGAGLSHEWRRDDDSPWLPISVHARYVDLAVVAQTDRGDALARGVDKVAEEIIMNASCPVLMVPYSGTFAMVGKRVMIGWNGRREAARAVRDAMPLLRSAAQIVVYCVTESKQDRIAGADIATQLARHNLRVEVVTSLGSDRRAGEALLGAVAEYGADMLVMGAYGHNRLREFVFGGATRHMLSHMRVPTLMSH